MIQWGKTSCRAPAIDLHLGCVYCKRAAAWCYSALPLCYNNVSFRWVCVICTNLCVQLSKKALKEDIDFISTGKHCPLLTWQWHRGWWVLRKQLKQGKGMFQNSIKKILSVLFLPHYDLELHFRTPDLLYIYSSERLQILQTQPQSAEPSSCTMLWTNHMVLPSCTRLVLSDEGHSLCASPVHGNIAISCLDTCIYCLKRVSHAHRTS